MSLMFRRKTRRTRHELLLLRDQLKLAQKAHSLLEEKYKVLTQEAQHISGVLLAFKQELDSKAKNAYALLSESIISLGLRNVYKAALSTKANDEVEMRRTIVRGLSVPKLVPKIQRRKPLERAYGLASTNYSLDKAADAFEDVLISLVEVAELDNILRIVKGEVKKTGIRASALEKILIPTLKSEIRKIEDKLEEREREMHTMIKWIKEREY